MRYFNTHSGKAVLAIGLAAFLLAVPVAMPWIAAVALIRYGVTHLKLAFREVEHDVSVHAAAGGPSLPDDRGRELAVTRGGSVPARPQVL